jgi:bifunctional non-homologous end joining protein LigD
LNDIEARLREDKAPSSIVRESPVTVQSTPDITPEVKLSHPDKVLYPELGLTKRDLARHLERVASRMLPHLDGRPLTLVRCPEGQHRGCWFQKHPTGALPEGIDRAAIREKEGKSDYLVVRREAGIVALAQLGALEAHIWGSRVDRLERPDRMVFDLDPAPEITFDEVVADALLLRDRLARDGLRSLPLLTGGKGVHVVVPLGRYHDFEVVRAFSGALARSLAREMPDRFLAKASKKAREGRVFIDYLRNGRGATAICPYSTRARPNASVAVPVSWEELPHVPSSAAFTLNDIEARLREPDPWASYFDIRQRLTTKALRARGVMAERRAGAARSTREDGR